jgi:hypothetical protein
MDSVSIILNVEWFWGTHGQYFKVHIVIFPEGGASSNKYMSSWYPNGNIWNYNFNVRIEWLMDIVHCTTPSSILTAQFQPVYYLRIIDCIVYDFFQWAETCSGDEYYRPTHQRNMCRYYLYWQGVEFEINVNDSHWHPI